MPILVDGFPPSKSQLSDWYTLKNYKFNPPTPLEEGQKIQKGKTAWKVDVPHAFQKSSESAIPLTNHLGVISHHESPPSPPLLPPPPSSPSPSPSSHHHIHFHHHHHHHHHHRHHHRHPKYLHIQ